LVNWLAADLQNYSPVTSTEWIFQYTTKEFYLYNVISDVIASISKIQSPAGGNKMVNVSPFEEVHYFMFYLQPLHCGMALALSLWLWPWLCLIWALDSWPWPGVFLPC